ncbi:hypothetical protein EPO05_04595 [Patescibacteria group bacterium]|nr:MAG: hypothetical protein EPO05_04595 [Patescibacteria group bacterium]
MQPEKLNRLYPERPSVGLDEPIEELRKIESGETKPLQLSERERTELLDFENGLGEELEKIYNMLVITTTLYPEYFLTDKGRQDLIETCGITLDGKDTTSIKAELCANRQAIAKTDAKKRSALAGRSETFVDEKLLKELSAQLDQDANLTKGEVHSPERVSLLLNPEKSLEKIQSLRAFREKLRKMSAENATLSTNLDKARQVILRLYRIRANQMTAEQFGYGVMTRNLAGQVGEAGLTTEEATLAKMFRGLDEFERNYSRMDRFIFGATADYDDAGVRRQVGQELVEYAEKMNREYLDNELNKDAKIREQGLDPEKIFKKDVTKEQFQSWEEELLEHYGLLSSESPENYTEDRIGPAPDGKWQFAARPEYKSLRMDGTQRVVKAGSEATSVDEVIVTLLGHETEGHAIQHENKSKVSLRMFGKVGGGRSVVFSEGGAVMVEDLISSGAFGFRTVPHPHYIRAMMRRMSGGTYIDCIKAFYASAIQAVQERKRQGKVSPDSFMTEANKKLKLAINRARRLFTDGADFTSTSSVLTKSKDTVYLEQALLLEKLKAAGLEKYAFVGGVNLNTLIELAKIGLIKTSDIRTPDFYALEIWERIKGNYALSA